MTKKDRLQIEYDKQVHLFIQASSTADLKEFLMWCNCFGGAYIPTYTSLTVTDKAIKRELKNR